MNAGMYFMCESFCWRASQNSKGWGSKFVRWAGPHVQLFPWVELTGVGVDCPFLSENKNVRPVSLKMPSPDEKHQFQLTVGGIGLLVTGAHFM